MIQKPTLLRESKHSLLSWDCLDCSRNVDSLTIHGKCPHCGSGAVTAHFALTVTPKCAACSLPMNDGELVTSDFSRHVVCENTQGTVNATATDAPLEVTYY